MLNFISASKHKSLISDLNELRPAGINGVPSSPNNQGVAKMGNSYHRTEWNWCKVSVKYGLYLYVISLDHAHEARNTAGTKHAT